MQNYFTRVFFSRVKKKELQPASHGFIAILCNGISNILGRGCNTAFLKLCIHDFNEIADRDNTAYTM